MSQIILVVYGFIIILIFPGLTGCHLSRSNAASQFNHGLNCYEKAWDDVIQAQALGHLAKPQFLKILPEEVSRK